MRNKFLLVKPTSLWYLINIIDIIYQYYNINIAINISILSILLSIWQPDLTNLGFPDSSVGKESACNAGDPGSIPGLGRSIGKGIGYPLQYSGLENSMDCIVHGVTKSQTGLSDFHSQPE